MVGQLNGQLLQLYLYMDGWADGRMNEWINLPKHDYIMVVQWNGQLCSCILTWMDG